MIKQIKTGVRLLRYTHGVTANIVLCGGIAFLGILASLYGKSTVMGTYLIVAAGMCPVQMLYSLGVSDMVQTSPWKKPIQTSISVVFGLLGMGVLYLVSALINFVRLLNHSIEEPMAANAMLMGGVMAVVVMLYIGFALKYFVTATIVFCGGIWFVMFVAGMSGFESMGISFGMSVLLGFVCLLVGGLLQYGVTLLVYRKPIAKQSQLAGLRKTM